MVELAAAEFPIFKPDLRELNSNANPSYTVETLNDLAKENPTAELYFFAGGDSLLTFTKWHKWQEFLTQGHLSHYAKTWISL